MFSYHRFCALAVGSGLLACQPAANWDAEFVCAGLEHSTTEIDGQNQPGMHKEIPLSVDLHLRGGHLLVKTWSAPVDASDGDRIKFEVRNPSGQIGGEFRPVSGALTYVEARHMAVADAQHRVTLSGQFQCQAVR